MIKRMVLGGIGLCLGLTACQDPVQDDYFPLGDQKETYRPQLVGERASEAVTLRWTWFTYGLPSSPERVNPERFVIFGGMDPSQLAAIEELDAGVNEFKAEGLKNGELYYFAVQAEADEAQAARSNLIMIMPEGPKLLATYFGNPELKRSWGSFSPDGQYLVYTREPFSNSPTTGLPPPPATRTVATLEIATGIETEWVEGTRPHWSPDGQQIVLETDLSQNDYSEGANTLLGIYTFDTESLAIYYGGDSYHHMPIWSPTQPVLAFLSDLDDEELYSLYTLPLDADPLPHRLTQRFPNLSQLNTLSDRSPQMPTYSPDGQHIAYARFVAKGAVFARDIFAIPSEGGQEMLLIGSVWNDYAPAYSPDGNRLAFISDRSGLPGIWVQDLNTGELQQVAGVEAQVAPAGGKLSWSPNGQRILFSSQAENGPMSLTGVDIP